MPYEENGVLYAHNSEMATFKRCRLKHHYAYKMNLVPLAKPRPLYLGTIQHVGLQFYYMGRDPYAAMDLAVAEDIQSVMDTGKVDGINMSTYISEAQKRLDLCTTVMENYIKYDSQNPIVRDGNIAIHDGMPMIERTYEVPVPGVWLDGMPVMYRFTLDLAYTQGGGIWIADHKTGKQFLDVRKLDLDTQLSLYIWALSQVVDKRVIGMEYNLIRMGYPKVPELVKKGDRLSVASIDTTWDMYEREIIRNGFDPNDYEDMKQKLLGKTFFDRKHRYRTDHELAVTEQELIDTVKDMIDPDCKIYRNPTNDCTWDCPYRQVCIMEYRGDNEEDVLAYIDSNYTVGINRRESSDKLESILDKM